MKRSIAFAVGAALLIPGPCVAKADPDCSGTDRWPAITAFLSMKNAGLFPNDHSPPAHTTVREIASQRIGRDLWRQVFDIVYARTGGSKLEAIVVSAASREECSMGEVQVFVVSNNLLPRVRNSN